MNPHERGDGMQTETLDLWIDEYGGAIYRFCLKLTSSGEDADDLYQETFLKAFEHLHQCKEADNPKGYLFSICINHWKSNHRRQAARRKAAVLTALDDAKLIDAGVDVEELVIAREQVSQIARAAAALDDRHRIPLYLHYTAELTVAEIAGALKIPEGTVKSRLFKARVLIQKRLGVNHREQGLADRDTVQTGVLF